MWWLIVMERAQKNFNRKCYSYIHQTTIKIVKCYMSADMLIFIGVSWSVHCFLIFLPFAVYITQWWLYPCDPSCSNVNHLHHPHTQPETHSSPHHSQELKEGEGGVKRFCNCYNLVKSQVKWCSISISISCILRRDSRSSYLKIRRSILASNKVQETYNWMSQQSQAHK